MLTPCYDNGDCSGDPTDCDTDYTVSDILNYVDCSGSCSSYFKVR